MPPASLGAEMFPPLAALGRPSDMGNGMPVALSPEQRTLVEDYLAKAEDQEAAGLWLNIIGAHGAGVAWTKIGWLAEMHGVPEEVVEALLTGLDLIDWDGQSRIGYSARAIRGALFAPLASTSPGP